MTTLDFASHKLLKRHFKIQAPHHIDLAPCILYMEEIPLGPFVWLQWRGTKDCQDSGHNWRESVEFFCDSLNSLSTICDFLCWEVNRDHKRSDFTDYFPVLFVIMSLLKLKLWRWVHYFSLSPRIMLQLHFIPQRMLAGWVEWCDGLCDIKIKAGPWMLSPH